MFKFPFHLYDRLVLGIITLFIVLIYLTNFAGNFWVTGWDNLHPEFNYEANIERASFSSWQEYQGVGLPAGHGHATEFSREVLLSALNVFVPTMEIRKIFILLMLWMGALGVYVFIRNILLSRIYFDLRILVSLIASLFYLFHIATVQIFYVPYEAFLAHYAFLPWMVYTLYRFMEVSTKKTFFLFLIVNFFGSWQFYIPTLFIVYMFLVSAIALGIVLEHKVPWKRVAVAFAGILIINLYWLLPFAYYTINNIHSQQEAYLNLLYTEDTYLKNAQFGDLQNATLLKGFLFDSIQFSNNNGFQYMMGPWIDHEKKWYVLFIGYSFFLVSLIGLITAIRNKKYIYLSVLFLFFFALIANQTFPFSVLNDLLRSVPLLDQIFRNPFTKFANTTLFLMTIFFSFGMVVIITRLQKYFAKFRVDTWFVYGLVLVVYLFCLNLSVLPLFQGNFVYPSLKINIPKEYFQLFEFFEHEKNGRIANLPQFTSNGWIYYKWGYQGSGFLWYGLKQPVLDRAFDVWNRDNENYYWELSDAIYAEDLSRFESILEKYQISWLIFDKNVTTPASSKILFTDELEAMIGKSSKISLVEQFGEIGVYKVLLQTRPDNYIYLQSTLPNISPAYQWNNRDQGYIEYGNYTSAEKTVASEVNVFYPFRSLFTGRMQEELGFSIQENNDYFSFRQEIPKLFSNSELEIPTIDESDITEIDVNNFNNTTTKVPLLSRKGDLLEVFIPKIKGYFSDETLVSSKSGELKPNNCNKFNKGSLIVDPIIGEDTLLHLQSRHSNNCLDFDMLNLSQKLSYLLLVTSKHTEGKSLYITVNNKTSGREELATYLPKDKNLTTSYFVLPSRQQYGIGYSVHVDNISLDKSATINELGEIKVYPIPYEFLVGLKYVKNAEKSGDNGVDINALSNLKVNRINPSSYALTFDVSKQTNYVVFAQSYNTGWKAYIVDGWLSTTFPILFGKELKEHMLINNWANGWKVDSELFAQDGQQVTIAIFFWPQLLQYLGFVLLPLPFIYIFWFKKKKD